MNKKNQKGFTLVELLAVIVILAVIAAIAVPSVASIINKSNKKAAVQDGLEMIHAAKLYVADKNKTPASDSGTLSIGKGELTEYLDDSSSNLPDNAKVTVKFTNGVPNYSIVDSKLPRDLSDKTEKALIEYNKQ